MNKWKPILKAQWGKKLLNAFTLATLGAAVAENPAVATASGWKQDKKGNWVLTPDKESAKLADNLATIGEAAVSAPTLTGDIAGLAHIVRHPILTVKSIPDIAKSVWWFGTHPNHTKVYHVSPNKFNLKEARTASSANVGLHVAESPHLAETAKLTQNGYTTEAYIPKADIETIDLYTNDWRLLSNNIETPRKPRPNLEGLHPLELWMLESKSGLNAAGDQPLYMHLLKKYGANPSKVKDKIYTTEKVAIPLRSETWHNISPEASRKANSILEEAKLGKGSTRLGSLELNQRTANLFSDNNIKVIKYHNANRGEFGDGNNVAYMITDPSVFHIPNKDALDIGKKIFGTAKQGVLGYGIYK